MMDHQWLMEGGVSGQTIQLVHTPVGVEYSTDQGRAQTPRKLNFFFVISFILTYILWRNIY